MKIAVIGANGKAGRLIAFEAWKRGHEVTGILRDADKAPGVRYPLLEKDLFDLTTDDLREYDVVISAFGLPFGGDHPADAYQQAYAHLAEIFSHLPDTRLLAVGGAGCLYTDETHEKRLVDTFPENSRKDPADMFGAYRLLQESGINCTWFSPAVIFDPRGKRTGEYITGPDEVVKNSSGESYISYEDYACAMVDEAENGKYIRRLFSAASDSRPVRKEKPYLGLRPVRPEFEGLSQYREPFNYELAGTLQRLVLDDGRRFAAEFLDGHTLRWTELGQSGTVEHYDCAKGGEDVYFVNFEFAGRKPRTNITLVLDTGDRLVTMVETVVGYHPKFPYMVDSQFTFGALEVPGYPLPERRHKYTADLLGKRIHWHYGPDMEIIHVYYATDYIRVTMPEKTGWGDRDRKSWDELVEREPYDEPAHYIKIKPGLYLVSCQEKNMACRGWTGNSLLFLIDTRRVHDVGRSFGHAGSETGKIHPENYIFGAFGEFVPSDGVLESQPNLYKARQVW
ncbi:MAG: MoaF N-terminal domain-containing protein [Clostridia bacterium]|nr:MoaF N-terminal domain-containing protein [Clostridia bacterium]